MNSENEYRESHKEAVTKEGCKGLANDLKGGNLAFGYVNRYQTSGSH